MVAAGILFGIGALLSWGIYDFFQKKAVDANGTLKNLFWTQGIGMVILLLLLVVVPQDISTLSGRVVLVMVAAGLFGVLGAAFFVRGLEKGTLSLVAPLSAIFPLITVAGALLFLGEQLTFLQLAAVGMIVAGSVAVSATGNGSLRKPEISILLALGAAFGWGVALFFVAVAVS